MNVFEWIILFEIAASCICEIISFYIFAKLLFRLKTNKAHSTIVEISPSLYAYFVVSCLTSIATLLYFIYYTLFRMSGYEIFNAYAWFWIFSAHKLMLVFLTFAVFVIGLERCFFILYPLKYKHTMMPLILSGILFIIVFIYTLIVVYLHGYPTCSLRECTRSTQNATKYAEVRYFSSALILIVCICLLLIIHKKFDFTFSKNLKGRSNKMILLTLLISFLFNFLPHILSFFFDTIIKINLVEYIGPWSTTVGSIESLFCALLYRNIYQKKPASRIAALPSMVPNTTD